MNINCNIMIKHKKRLLDDDKEIRNQIIFALGVSDEKYSTPHCIKEVH